MNKEYYELPHPRSEHLSEKQIVGLSESARKYIEAAKEKRARKKKRALEIQERHETAHERVSRRLKRKAFLRASWRKRKEVQECKKKRREAARLAVKMQQRQKHLRAEERKANEV